MFSQVDFDSTGRIILFTLCVAGAGGRVCTLVCVCVQVHAVIPVSPCLEVKSLNTVMHTGSHKHKSSSNPP